MCIPSPCSLPQCDEDVLNNMSEDAALPEKIHGLSHLCYHCVLFFAYWFGSSSFDFDGDGDFDHLDVQSYLVEKGLLDKKYAVRRTPKDRARQPRPVQARPSYLKQVSSFDCNGDGDVDLDDVKAACGSQVEGDQSQEQDMVKAFTEHKLPWFMLVECSMVFGLWCMLMLVDTLNGNSDASPLQIKAGLETIWPGKTDLRWFSFTCDNQSAEVWRWLTYQFTHVGAMHVAMNVLLNVMLGVPLECIHGWWRMAIMFNVGIFGGALNYYPFEGHLSVVGCSGGCYSLIGIHLADLVMNWHQKRYRFPMLVLLVTLVSVDLLCCFLSQSSKASHAAHGGGFVAGLVIGILVCRNTRKKAHEYGIMVVAAVIGTGLILFAMSWIFAQGKDGPANLWDVSEDSPRWCWYSAVYDSAVDTDNWLCVRCASKACVDRILASFTYIRQPMFEFCQAQGWWYDEGR